ncbi:MAG: hypothetical protein ABID54_10415, partial [Pseudomonadota bacterium]
LAINCQRRHMTKEQRDALIRALPTPEARRPKKGEQVISKKELAKELGVSESTIKRARGKRGSNEPLTKKSKKIKKICTPPDAVAPLVPSEESKSGVVWFADRHRDIFDKAGFVKGIGYSMEFTKDQIDYDWLVRQTENCMNDLLGAIKKAGLEHVVGKYRMTVQFEARKKEAKE